MSCDFFCYNRFTFTDFFYFTHFYRSNMGASAIPIIIFTVLWGVVGVVLPFVIPKGPNRGILQVILMLTAATCWIFWLCCYMAQMNPLIGPKLTKEVLIIIRNEWGGVE